MYVEAEMMQSLIPVFLQEVSATQLSIMLSADKDLLCSSISAAAPNLGNLVQSSTISEYDLGVEGDLFKAPEPILESLLSVQPLITTEDIAVTDIGSIESEDLLSEVFYNCKNDLLEKSAIIDSPAQSYDGKLHSVQNVEDSGVSFPGSVPTDYLLSEVFSGCQKELFETSDAEGTLQKSASLGCISTEENANNSSNRPRFLDFHEVDLGAEFGMRRAYSEGDIQTLGNQNCVLGNTSTVPSSYKLISTIGNVAIEEKIKERREKLSRYREKRTNRNFGRKIKYACRKALADSQPRIRGRFAKTEEKLTKSEVVKQQL